MTTVGAQYHRTTATVALRAALAVCLVAVAACADIATAPIPLVTLQGSVRTPKGAPVPGVELDFYPPAPEFVGATPAPKGADARNRGLRATRPVLRAGTAIPRVFTGLDGTFAVDLPAATFDIYMDPPEGSGVPFMHISRFSVGRVKPRFDYRYSGLEVTGRVTGPGNVPVLYANLTFYSHDVYFSVSSRFDGTRYLAYLQPGLYSLNVGSPSVVSGIPSIYFPTIPVHADTTIDVALTGSLVSGTVTGPDGSPLGASTVYFSASNAEAGTVADGLGRYSLYVPDGSYEPDVFPPVTRRDIFSRRFAASHVAGPSTVNIPFAGITWSGVVRATGSGTPIEGATVRVVGLDYLYMSYLGRAQTTTDASGSYRLFLESPEGYRLSATALGYQNLGTIEASAGSDSTFDIYMSATTP